MQCIKCNGKTSVYDCRLQKLENVKIRRRICEFCGEKFSTREIVWGKSEQYRKKLSIQNQESFLEIINNLVEIYEKNYGQIESSTSQT